MVSVNGEVPLYSNFGHIHLYGTSCYIHPLKLGTWVPTREWASARDTMVLTQPISLIYFRIYLTHLPDTINLSSDDLHGVRVSHKIILSEAQYIDWSEIKLLVLHEHILRTNCLQFLILHTI